MLSIECFFIRLKCFHLISCCVIKLNLKTSERLCFNNRDPCYCQGSPSQQTLLVNVICSHLYDTNHTIVIGFFCSFQSGEYRKHKTASRGTVTMVKLNVNSCNLSTHCRLIGVFLLGVDHERFGTAPFSPTHSLLLNVISLGQIAEARLFPFQVVGYKPTLLEGMAAL